MASPKSSVAIFGATGGTGLATLRCCLSAGHSVRALARTPSKLASLSAQYPNLSVVHGDVKDASSVRETLLQADGRVVDVVVSAIGMTIEMSGLSFTSSDPHVCEAATRGILAALDAVPGGPPLVVLLSTTGISSKSRDVPLAMLPLYHWMLAVPHADKKKLEELVIGSGKRWVLVRPSLLQDGEAKGLRAVRTGVELPGEKRGEGADHAIGYVIRREDVGKWIYEECVRGDGEKWEGRCVSLTY